jgi:alpha-ketoglutarate-dependent sulfate ester dioxygenase
MSTLAVDVKADVTVEKVGGRIGAVISGIRLSGDLDEAVVARIRSAILDHKVVFFRDQGHLDDTSYEAFASLFGQPAGHPSATRRVREIGAESRFQTNVWHTDVTYVAAYPTFGLLQGIEIPAYGGETAWANTVAAYANLPAPLQRLANELWALHATRHANGDEFETEHPLVRVHPETGELSLVLGSTTKQIIGISATDSTLLIQLFQDNITRLENTIRWRWAAGDVAIWDNRATQHSAVDDYGDLTRRLRRAIIEGDAPVGVDGRSSTIVKGADLEWRITGDPSY